MLTVFNDNKGYVIACDDYYVRQLASGLNEIIFEVNIHDDSFQYIVEEASIIDRDENYYLVKQIDRGLETAKVVCQIDLDEWRNQLFFDYSNNSSTVYNTIFNIKPEGWNVIDQSRVTIRRTIPTAENAENFNVTAWEIVEECMNTYNIRVLIDNHNRVLTIVNPDNYEPLGAFATKELNIKELNYKGKSQGFATRLYAYGKDNLTFADINDGKQYVDDNTYSSRVICAYWKDERYTDVQSLLEDAKKKLHAMATPQRSYDCDVVDLQSTNPELYGYQNFDLFQVVTLLDHITETAINHQVVERWEFPHYPEKNKVILSTQTPKIQSQVAQITNSINNPVSTFQQIMNAIIQSQTEAITGQEGGYVVMRDRDGDGKPDEILIMDTEDIATAVNVIRFNNAGMGFSTSGYNGPYRNAWTIDGQFTADNITGGTMSAGEIRGINIFGSVLTFGDEPNTVTLRTNDDLNGGIMEGTGNIKFSTKGQYRVENYFSDGTLSNTITLEATNGTRSYSYIGNRDTTGTEVNYLSLNHYYGTDSDRNVVTLSNKNYDDGTKTANYINLTSYKNNTSQTYQNNTLSLYNLDKNGDTANFMSMWHNPTSKANNIRIANNQVDNKTNYANTLFWYSTQTGNYFYFENYKVSSTLTKANQLFFSSGNTNNSLYIRNYYISGEVVANYFNMSASSGYTNLTITNNKYNNSSQFANQLAFTSGTTTNIISITNREASNAERTANAISMTSFQNGTKNQMVFSNYQRGSNNIKNSIITMDDNITFQCQNWHSFGFLGNDRQFVVSGCTHFIVNGVDLIGRNLSGVVIPAQ